jgi:hypothetical protein
MNSLNAPIRPRWIAAALAIIANALPLTAQPTAPAVDPAFADDAGFLGEPPMRAIVALGVAGELRSRLE